MADVRVSTCSTGTRTVAQRLGAALLVLVIGVGAWSLIDGWAAATFRATPADAWIAAAVWAGWAVVAGAGIAWFTGGPPPGRRSVVGLAICWGLVAAPWLADNAVQLWPVAIDEHSRFAITVVAPIDEEIAKMLGVMVILTVLPATAGLRAGMRTGMYVGLGFGVLEGWAYAVVDMRRGPRSALAATQEVWERGVVSLPYSHLALSGITGLGAAALLDRRRPAAIRIVHGVAALVTAISIHGLHNRFWPARTTPPITATVILALAGLVAAVLLITARSRTCPTRVRR